MNGFKNSQEEAEYHKGKQEAIDNFYACTIAMVQARVSGDLATTKKASKNYDNAVNHVKSYGIDYYQLYCAMVNPTPDGFSKVKGIK